MVSIKDRFKILFAEEQPGSKPLANLFGLPVPVSQQAADLLAAQWLTFNMMRSLLIPQEAPAPVLPGMAPEPEEEESGPDLRGLGPVAREAILRSWGYVPAEEAPAEPDPTHDEVKKIIDAENAKHLRPMDGKDD